MAGLMMDAAFTILLAGLGLTVEEEEEEEDGLKE